MRQIKFCGKTFEWKFVYGDLIHGEGRELYEGDILEYNIFA